MRSVDVNSWEQFEEQLRAIKEEQQKSENPNALFLFRGQGSSKWRLATTLERNKPENATLGEYYRLISKN
jgi:hypothetical protein